MKITPNLKLALALTAALVAANSLGPRPSILAQETTWAKATAEDMQMFAPYIGTWQTETRTAVNGKDVYFLIDYQWYDRQQHIVSLKIRQVLDGVEMLTTEGFYGVHPTEPRIYHFMTGITGIFGTGGVLSFDRESHQRTTRTTGRGPDGVVVELRDRFEVVDAEHWKATTSMLQNGQWNVVREDTFTKVTSGS